MDGTADVLLSVRKPEYGDPVPYCTGLTQREDFWTTMMSRGLRDCDLRQLRRVVKGVESRNVRNQKNPKEWISGHPQTVKV